MVIFMVQFFGNTLVQSYNYVHSKILHIEQACVYEVCKNLKKNCLSECFGQKVLSLRISLVLLYSVKVNLSVSFRFVIVSRIRFIQFYNLHRETTNFNRKIRINHLKCMSLGSDCPIETE